MPRPMSSSSVTDDTVKISVCLNAAHHSGTAERVGVVAQPDDPAQRERPGRRTLYSCSDSQIA